jgi:transcriptional regulator
MYIPGIYKNNNQQEVENFIIDNGFGIVVSQNNSKISATHVPLILKENNAGQKILEGHVSKSNP